MPTLLTTSIEPGGTLLLRRSGEPLVDEVRVDGRRVEAYCHPNRRVAPMIVAVPAMDLAIGRHVLTVNSDFEAWSEPFMVSGAPPRPNMPSQPTVRHVGLDGYRDPTGRVWVVAFPDSVLGMLVWTPEGDLVAATMWPRFQVIEDWSDDYRGDDSSPWVSLLWSARPAPLVIRAIEPAGGLSSAWIVAAHEGEMRVEPASGRFEVPLGADGLCGVAP